MKIGKQVSVISTAVLVLTTSLVLYGSQNTAPLPQRFINATYDVRTFGAKGDGQTLDTPALNKAVDAAALAGGGTVYFPARPAS